MVLATRLCTRYCYNGQHATRSSDKNRRSHQSTKTQWGLEVNRDKVKYLVMSRGTRDDSNPTVKDVQYLGADVGHYNNTHNEIKLRISGANKGYYALGQSFKSELPSGRPKVLELPTSGFDIRVWNAVNYQRRRRKKCLGLKEEYLDGYMDQSWKMNGTEGEQKSNRPTENPV